MIHEDTNGVFGPAVPVIFFTFLMESGPIESQSIQSLFAMLLLIVMELQRRLATSSTHGASEAAASSPPEPAVTNTRSHGSCTSSSWSGAENQYSAAPGPVPSMPSMPTGQARHNGACPHACAFCQNPCSRPTQRRAHRHHRCNFHRDM